ncbi:uncharacterized protein LOC132157920 [Carassius carassius]|uniref:uncharacterized protein LOC132157920 n=1 Tax=Carassius carassius TaxID=217509 RepID=UPI002868BEE6|nr:uncharacterized protein LOC132157920 [Carassius carassius]
MCGICRTLFRCTWRLNGHMEKHRKDIMEVKPVVKMEQTEEIGIKENIRYTDMRQITLMDHSYCVSDQAATNDTCSAIQKHIDNDTNSTNQESRIETQTERLPLFDKQNDTLSFSLCPSVQSEREHLSFKLKVEYEDGLGETAACEVAAQDKIGLMEDDESTDTDEDVNAIPPNIRDARGYYNIISAPLQGFSEDCSDEDDYMTPLGPKSEEGSVCCVCGENIPLLNELIDHFKTHTAEVSCHLCWTKFGQVISLAVHLKNAHPRKNFMCGICRTLFRCTWRLNGHMEKHRKDIMEVKPVVKMEQTEEIGIKENIRYTDMRQITLMDHSYCVSDQAATNDTCSAIQKHIDNDTNSTNQESRIETQTERLPLFDKQNDTLSFSLCPSVQSEREHLSFKLKVEYEDGLGETAACEVAAQDKIGLMEDDESTDTDEDVNAIPPNIRDARGYYNIISAPLQGFSEDCSDEDDYMTPLGPKSEEGSVCCVCGENIPLLNELIDHFKTHTAEVSCHLCRTKFGQVISLAVHLKNAHPRKNFMCGICRTLFRCTWRLNGHMEKHRKDIMEVKPVVKMEQTEEIGIKENIRYTDMRQITLMDHSYCVSDQAATNDTCSAIGGLRETAACEVAAEDEIGLMEDDESTDTDEDVNTYSLLSGDTAYNLDDDFSSESDDSDSRSSSCGRHQSVKTISPAPDPPHLTLQQLLQTTPLVPAKVSDLVPQFVAMPQTLIRPHFPHSSCVARPKIPVHIPSVVQPLMSNLSRMTPCIPTTSNPPFPSQVVISFSPTVNVSAPCLVSTNRPVLRQTPAAIRPLPVNVPLMTSVTCPTLVIALTEHNQPQIPPAQVQAPLQVVAMFVNQSRDLALQKRLKQSWRSKTIFPCRHCGAVSRQPSLKVRHRYLHLRKYI